MMDSPYCFPISKDELVLRLRVKKGDAKEVSVLYESKYVIGSKHKSAVMRKAYSGELFDYYEICLKLKDTRLAYVFYINDGKECFYFSEDGLSEEYDFKLGYYNFFQYPYINEADIVKPVEWMKTAVFYQIFVERFDIGDKKKDLSYVTMNWGDIPTPKSFAGGDLKGITKRLSYIKGLGVDSIYLTPVFESISNHKYDISDYYNVAGQFGTNDDLKELVDEAHKKGMHIVLDAVFNHCSDRMMQFEDVKRNGKKSPYFDWFIIHGDRIDESKCNYETFASCKYMPKLNTSNEEVRKFLIDIALYYISEYKIDGWRLDVSDEISFDFWREFRKAVKNANPDAVIIGENWHDAYANLRGDQYDSIMNYAFTKLCLDYFARKTKNAKEASEKLNELLIRNKAGVNEMMLNLLDSHDTLRFFTEVNEDRDIMKCALALLFFYMGTPCIFYGTEILTVGKYDPDCRRCMDWDRALKKKDTEDIVNLLNKLAKIKRKKDFSKENIFISEKDGCLFLERESKKAKYALYINMQSVEAGPDNYRIMPKHFIITKDGELIDYEKDI